MRFVDEARMRVQAGNGGRGCLSFRREKFMPFGGPDGGDGGHGGSVFLRATLGINTLADFRVERTFKAQSGDSGSGNDCTGRGGDDLYVPVPVGTIVRDAETHEQLGDLVRDGDVLQVAQGGKGGWGKLPNVAEIHYEDDDARGWTYVGPHKRNRGCKIVDDPDQF